MVNSNDGIKTEVSIDYDMNTWEPKIDFISFSSQNLWGHCQQSFRSIFEVPTFWNWTPLGKMINFGSFAQRNTLDQWSNDPSLDHTDQWSDISLSRVDLIDHWPENGFARKERHRSEILIRILPKERTLHSEDKNAWKDQRLFHRKFQCTARITIQLA